MFRITSKDDKTKKSPGLCFSPGKYVLKSADFKTYFPGEKQSPGDFFVLSSFDVILNIFLLKV